MTRVFLRALLACITSVGALSAVPAYANNVEAPCGMHGQRGGGGERERGRERVREFAASSSF